MSIFALYVVGSLALSGVAIANSYSNYQQFYLMIEHLTSSKTHKTVILNAVFALFIFILGAFMNFFFGEIKEIERIHTIDKVKRKIIEFALMLIVFKDDILDQVFLAYFVGLMSLSVVHWIAIKRSEFLIIEGQQQKAKYLKLLILFLILIWIDYTIMEYFYHHVYLGGDVKGSHDQLLLSLFGFEFLILAMGSALPFIKYITNLFELVTFSHYESKQTMFSVLEFVFTMAKLIIELMLINFIRKNFVFPIHLFGEYIENIINLITTVRNFWNTIALILRLNKLPNVTPADIEEIDSVCLICLNEIQTGKKIPCGHIFHYNCLKTWIQGNTNQFCPKCKVPIKIQAQPVQAAAPNNNIANFEFFGQANDAANAAHPVEQININSNADNYENLELNRLILENALSTFALDKPTSPGQKFDLFLTRENMIDMIFKESDEKIPMDQLGSFEYGLPRKAIAYKSQQVEACRKKVELFNSLLAYTSKINPILQQAELIRRINVQPEAPGQAESNSQLLQNAAEEQINTVPIANSGIKTSVLSTVPLQQEDSSVYHDDENLDENVRRRQLILEAHEKRAQSFTTDVNPEGADSNKVTTLPDDKKTQ